MAESMVVYENGGSKCMVEYDGDMVRIEQLLDNEIVSSTFLYIDEFEEIVRFIEKNNNK